MAHLNQAKISDRPTVTVYLTKLPNFQPDLGWDKCKCAIKLCFNSVAGWYGLELGCMTITKLINIHHLIYPNMALFFSIKYGRNKIKQNYLSIN